MQILFKKSLKKLPLTLMIFQEQPLKFKIDLKTDVRSFLVHIWFLKRHSNPESKFRGPHMSLLVMLKLI